MPSSSILRVILLHHVWKLLGLTMLSILTDVDRATGANSEYFQSLRTTLQKNLNSKRDSAGLAEEVLFLLRML